MDPNDHNFKNLITILKEIERVTTQKNVPNTIKD